MHRERGVVDQPDLPGGDGVHGGAFRCRNVDAVVELEETGPVDAVGQEGVPEPRARIPEVGADDMLLVERLDRPGVGEAALRTAQGGEEEEW